ncbi:MAG TPA: outer membrane beta-barrel protein [Aestuariivirga sp.]|nr:outer membrane beta-barrel protein [Aestuariivirga sp.]
MKMCLAVFIALLGGINIAYAAENAPAPNGFQSFEWTGFYIGAYGAYGFGDTRSSDGIDSEPQDPYPGIHAGYALELEKIVIGIEGDLSLADLDGDTGSGAGFVSQDIDNIAAISGRIGLPFDNMLVFMSAGWSWADSERNTIGSSDTEFLNGPTLGGGFQFGLGHHMVGRFEYVHIDYGKVTYDIIGSPKVDSNVDVVKVGLDYIF